MGNINNNIFMKRMRVGANRFLELLQQLVQNIFFPEGLLFVLKTHKTIRLTFIAIKFKKSDFISIWGKTSHFGTLNSFMVNKNLP